MLLIQAPVCLQEALKLNPGSPEALYLLAFALSNIAAWDRLKKPMARLRKAVQVSQTATLLFFFVTLKPRVE